ncbi:hypothetical protein CEUSTIGMA_g4357.t1 [Chlamydomonas eustigma]|uniref:Uncharacterized protein n=1 Tax=Chlamydomonas eustigma TaxID=1157962 RepID=A0A250X1G0_9CHLO|nr:hypothetical protein CEUSTIGMA_g4357.t1 [Chlamydomonas eustigma]|eukprot:GAX76911.1 hypothetical protein CEUSTIGMA_g4357.t1 [Chlamydomonas eustigma]
MLLEKEAVTERRQIFVFLAPTAALCLQQATVLRRAGLRVRLRCGNGALDDDRSDATTQPAAKGLPPSIDLSLEPSAPGTAPGTAGVKGPGGGTRKVLLKNAAWWQTLLDSPGSVLVATPAVLIQALVPGHVKMSHIGVLILDEVHHCSGEGPYMLLIREFWSQASVQEGRPRLLGLTASPVQVLDKNGKAAEDVSPLERSLQAVLLTAPDKSEVQFAAPSALEQLFFYRRSYQREVHKDVVDCMMEAATDMQKATELLLCAAQYKEIKAVLLEQLEQQEHSRENGGSDILTGGVSISTMSGLLLAQGANHFRVMARQVNDMLYCLKELGLWACLVAFEHILLSSVDKIFCGEEDEDEDEEEEEEEDVALSLSALEKDEGSAGKKGYDESGQGYVENNPRRQRRMSSSAGGGVGDPGLEKSVGGYDGGDVEDDDGDEMIGGGALWSLRSRWLDDCGLIISGSALRKRKSQLRSLHMRLLQETGRKSTKGLVAAAALTALTRVAMALLQLVEPMEGPWEEQYCSVAAGSTHDADVMKKSADVSSGQSDDYQEDPANTNIDDYLSLKEAWDETVSREGLPGLFQGQYMFFAARLRARLSRAEMKRQVLNIPTSNPLPWFTHRVQLFLKVLLQQCALSNVQDSCNLEDPQPPKEASDVRMETEGTNDKPLHDMKEGWGCMTFVKRKVTALVLDALMHQLVGAGVVTAGAIRSRPFIGETGISSTSLSLAMNLKEQRQLMEEFQSGSLNLLIATQVGAEGLDFGRCNLVVMFDLPNHCVNYMQCKGRARHSNALYIVMMEAGDVVQERKLLSLKRQVFNMQLAIAMRHAAATGSYPKEPSEPTALTTVSFWNDPIVCTSLASSAQQNHNILSSLNELAAEARQALQELSTRNNVSPTSSAEACTAHTDASSKSMENNLPVGDFILTSSSIEMVVDPKPNADVNNKAPGMQQRHRELDSTWAPVTTFGRAPPPLHGQPLLAGSLPAADPGAAYELASGVRCPLSCALYVLQKFCMDLPGNTRYIRLSPRFLVRALGSGMYQSTLLLPINARLPPLDGPPVLGRQRSQQAVCLKAIKMLHTSQPPMLDDKLQLASLHLMKNHYQLAAELVDNDIEWLVPRVTLPHTLPDILKPRPQLMLKKQQQSQHLGCKTASPLHAEQQQPHKHISITTQSADQISDPYGADPVLAGSHPSVSDHSEVDGEVTSCILHKDVDACPAEKNVKCSGTERVVCVSDPAENVLPHVLLPASSSSLSTSPWHLYCFHIQPCKEPAWHLTDMPLLGAVPGSRRASSTSSSSFTHTSHVHPFGALLRNPLPLDALPPFSIWLEGGDHALVTLMHMGVIGGEDGDSICVNRGPQHESVSVATTAAQAITNVALNSVSTQPGVKCSSPVSALAVGHRVMASLMLRTEYQPTEWEKQLKKILNSRLPQTSVVVEDPLSGDVHVGDEAFINAEVGVQLRTASNCHQGSKSGGLQQDCPELSRQQQGGLENCGLEQGDPALYRGPDQKTAEQEVPKSSGPSHLDLDLPSQPGVNHLQDGSPHPLDSGWSLEAVCSKWNDAAGLPYLELALRAAGVLVSNHLANSNAQQDMGSVRSAGVNPVEEHGGGFVADGVEGSISMEDMQVTTAASSEESTFPQGPMSSVMPVQCQGETLRPTQLPEQLPGQLLSKDALNQSMQRPEDGMWYISVPLKPSSEALLKFNKAGSGDTHMSATLSATVSGATTGKGSAQCEDVDTCSAWEVDWDVLTGLCRGVCPVQQLVDLGPFAFPSSPDAKCMNAAAASEYLPTRAAGHHVQEEVGFGTATGVSSPVKGTPNDMSCTADLACIQDGKGPDAQGGKSHMDLLQDHVLFRASGNGVQRFLYCGYAQRPCVVPITQEQQQQLHPITLDDHHHLCSTEKQRLAALSTQKQQLAGMVAGKETAATEGSESACNGQVGAMAAAAYTRIQGDGVGVASGNQGAKHGGSRPRHQDPMATRAGGDVASKERHKLPTFTYRQALKYSSSNIPFEVIPEGAPMIVLETLSRSHWKRNLLLRDNEERKEEAAATVKAAGRHLSGTGLGEKSMFKQLRAAAAAKTWKVREGATASQQSGRGIGDAESSRDCTEAPTAAAASMAAYGSSPPCKIFSTTYEPTSVPHSSPPAPCLLPPVPGSPSWSKGYSLALPCTLLVHPLPLRCWEGLQQLPAFMWRLETMLSSEQFRHEIMMARGLSDITPDVGSTMAVLSTRPCCEPFSCEAAEFVGDAVLDFLVSVYLFTELSSFHESVLTEGRVRLVCNEVLVSRAQAPQLALQRFVRYKALDALLHLSRGCLLDDDAACRPVKGVQGKRVADLVEALIGVVFLRNGGGAAVNMGRAYVTPTPVISVPEDIHAAAAAPGGSVEDHMAADGSVGGHMATDFEIEICPKSVHLSAQTTSPSQASNWNSVELTAAFNHTALLCERLGVLPAGGHDVLKRVLGAWTGTESVERPGLSHGGDGSVTGVTSTLQDAAGGNNVTMKEGRDGLAVQRVLSRNERRQRKIGREVSVLLGGYTFKNLALLTEALTHCSYSVGPCNQRLEFLGDAVLDMIITMHLLSEASQSVWQGSTYSSVGESSTGCSKQVAGDRGTGDIMFGDAPIPLAFHPDSLTHKRGELVSNRTLAQLCALSGLHKHMRYSMASVQQSINSFIKQLTDKSTVQGLTEGGDTTLSADGLRGAITGLYKEQAGRDEAEITNGVTFLPEQSLKKVTKKKKGKNQNKRKKDRSVSPSELRWGLEQTMACPTGHEGAHVEQDAVDEDVRRRFAQHAHGRLRKAARLRKSGSVSGGGSGGEEEHQGGSAKQHLLTPPSDLLCEGKVDTDLNLKVLDMLDSFGVSVDEDKAEAVEVLHVFRRGSPSARESNQDAMECVQQADAMSCQDRGERMCLKPSSKPSPILQSSMLMGINPGNDEELALQCHKATTSGMSLSLEDKAMSCKACDHTCSPHLSPSPDPSTLMDNLRSSTQGHISAEEVNVRTLSNPVEDDGWGLIGRRWHRPQTAAGTIKLPRKSTEPAAMDCSYTCSSPSVSYSCSNQTSTRTSRSGSSDCSDHASTDTSSTEGAMTSDVTMAGVRDGNGVEAPGSEGPKLLADLVEAILGAVLLDSGGDVVACWNAYQGLVQAAKQRPAESL